VVSAMAPSHPPARTRWRPGGDWLTECLSRLTFGTIRREHF
jgi:hypothetical protein